MNVRSIVQAIGPASLEVFRDQEKINVMEYHKRFTWNRKKCVKVQEVPIEELQEQNMLQTRQSKRWLSNRLPTVLAYNGAARTDDMETFQSGGAPSQHPSTSAGNETTDS